jgi:hypothetical protein
MTDFSPIQAALLPLAASSALRDPARALFGVLGYRSEKLLDLAPNTAQGLQETFEIALAPHRALLSEWVSVDVLFQLTDDEIRQSGQQSGQAALVDFVSDGQVDNARIASYLFFALRLRGEHYTRTQLATITRELNVHFPMPILILFQHGETLTIAIINRRIQKRNPPHNPQRETQRDPQCETQKDVLDKVTLIKDINATSPHRAHLDILADLALPALARQYPIGNVVELQRAWEYVLSSSELNKRFHREIANWYCWATQHVTFPAGGEPDEAKRNNISIIRLITRLIFVWFLKEKGLVPADLFSEQRLHTILVDMSPEASSYYKAILQNLFFATLNREMGKRGFRKKTIHPNERDQNRLVTDLYRYQDYFADRGDTLLSLTRNIPFLNGGLFECLDHENEDRQVVRIDGFSDETKNPLSVPNMLFFAGEQEVDLPLNTTSKGRSRGTSGRAHKVRGLIPILNRYPFTITENTPIEEEIAIDPELPGQVFENLLAAYNPETGATARKQTGSFYTPREVVNYMVDETLLAYLETVFSAPPAPPPDIPPPGGGIGRGDSEPLAARLRHLLACTDEPPQFDDRERTELIAAIDRVKILDPACGSGAFPIGMLQKLVFLLEKLDPGNRQWKQRQIDNVHREMERVCAIEGTIEDRDNEVREAVLASLAQKLHEIERAFACNTLDYGRKRYLIQNCMYGVDIQPIAVQIAKLRCIITLIVDQQADDSLENHGILTLPNLETRFVAANTLDSFDPEKVFAVDEGFDIVLGNPPYVSALVFAAIYGTEAKERFRSLFKSTYETARGSYDMYVLFIERGIALLRSGGTLSYITPNKYLSARYAIALRSYILKKATLRKLVDLSAMKMFKDACVYPLISFLQRDAGRGETVTILQPEESNREMVRFNLAAWCSVDIDYQMLGMLPEYIWGFMLSPQVEFLSKLVNGTQPLSSFGEINATSTAAEADTYGAFIAEHCKDGSLRMLNTGTIDRYTALWGIRSMIHAHRTFATPYLPLREAGVNKRRERMYTSPKIIFAKLANVCEAYIDADGEYASLNTTCFHSPGQGVSLNFIGAFCNSKLFMFLYRQLFGALRMRGGYFQFQAPQLRAIPLKPFSEEQQAPIIALVERILEAKRDDAGADVSALDMEIDEHLYRLYGLTGDEREIVEGV